MLNLAGKAKLDKNIIITVIFFTEKIWKTRLYMIMKIQLANQSYIIWWNRM